MSEIQYLECSRFLFRVGIVSDPSCRCGAALENLKHFFLDCPIYIQARTILIFKLFHIFIVEGIKESLVEDSLQKGKIIAFPFLNGYIDVLVITS
jgi:hypothetical protein